MAATADAMKRENFMVGVDRGKIALRGNVRFGSKANMCSAKRHVRFTPHSDHESGFPQKVMSALPPKADMCGAQSGQVDFI
jgi:hypothetical protein